MEAIEFEEQTIIIAKDQPEYLPLPAHQYKDEYGTITFCMKLSFKERIKVLFGGIIWYSVLTFNKPLQPQRMSVDKPEMQKTSKK